MPKEDRDLTYVWEKLRSLGSQYGEGRKQRGSRGSLHGIATVLDTLLSANYLRREVRNKCLDFDVVFGVQGLISITTDFLDRYRGNST